MKMGDIIASTPLSKTTYILGKWIGNVIVLQFVVLIMFLFSIFMQLISGYMEIDLIKCAIPFMIIAMPAMLIVATVSLLFDVVPFSRNVLGSILYFFIWMFYMGISTSSTNSLGDLSGLSNYWESFGNSLKQVYPDVQDGTSFLFMYEGEATPFSWKGIQFSQSFIVSRFIITLFLTLLCVFLSILFFDRFLAHAKTPIFNFSRRKAAKIEQTKGLSNFTLGSLQKNDIRFDFFATFAATFNVLFKMIPLSLWGIEAALGIALVIIPSEEVKHILYSIIWLTPMFFWSQMGVFHNKYGMKDLCSSTLISNNIQLFFTLITGVSLSIILCFGTIVQSVIKSNFLGIIHIVIGGIFICSLVLCIGTIMKKTKLFEICYVLIWYYGVMDNSVNQLDFLAISQDSIVLRYPYLYLLYSVIFFGIATIIITTDYDTKRT